MEDVGGDGGVAGQAGAERGEQGLGEHAEHDVEVDVEVDGRGQGVGVEGADDLGEALLDGHPAGVVGDQGLVVQVVVVGDDDGGGVAAQAGDDELPHGAGVAGQPAPVASCTRGRLCGPGRSRVIVLKSLAGAGR